MNRHHSGNIHIVGSKAQGLFHPAFNIDRAFSDQGSLHFLTLQKGQLHVLYLIRIPAAFYAAVIRCICKLPVCQVDHKLTGLLYHIMRITLRPYRYGHHRRIAAHRPCPGNGKHIGLSLLICNGNQHCRHRIQHISRLKAFFFHRNHHVFPSLKQV